jgi:dTDP-4-dehydrorhamnose reductase/dTDP-4-dehydrorhamnose 3,5-epimerase
MQIETTPIPGLLVLRLDVHGDNRGWFRENWQREKMVALGVPDFEPVQHNLSYNGERGVTRGIHLEPWDKLVSVVTGRVFGAWVDFREGPGYGRSHHLEIDRNTAVFIPRGVGNSYQTLDEGVTYSYLINNHFDPSYRYPGLRLDDPTAAIPWPIPISEAILSEKDQNLPSLGDVVPLEPRKTLILGCHGQLGRALVAEFPDADAVDIDELDLTDPKAVDAWPWRDYDRVLNAAAYTAVDAAETAEGRRSAWAANAGTPATLARLADQHRQTLVHFSTEYVFDGSVSDHTEDEPLSPLGVYAQTKAAGDLAVATAKRHYVLRTSWLVGDGGNFVRTMQRLAAEGVSPRVVDDQVGRLTFADELARATRHLLEADATYGVYHCSGSGPATTWAEVARRVFELAGRDPDDVTPVSTEEYAAGRDLAPRPRSSTMSLAKLEATGFSPRPAWDSLTDYLQPQRS